ncbi:DUF523 domain-containing protein [Shewanella putrefaciens]|uniref:Uncharacterized protein n=1 Tax=Shewanella putrefaciens (strain CN-32 / ATCC BAA-453) TaxID=319224 RepID=A4YBL7_SHEPC|nr:DUF523 domain-containing protein [Shewanella putrefaciens]QGS48307.1 DUF523 domain-containing protein [Shewanella putrefaciens]
MGGMRHLGMTVEKVLVSSCLLGQAVRYDGGHNLMESELVQTWLEQGRIVAICPECAGGLPTPRPPAERIGQRILTVQGEDVTLAFSLGADIALKLAQQERIKVAILKARSPSCGNRLIYDGQFVKQLIAGQGLTAEKLSAAGITVFNEFELSDAAAFVTELEASSVRR